MVQLNNHYDFLYFQKLQKSRKQLARTVNHITFLVRCKSSDIILKLRSTVSVLVLFLQKELVFIDIKK
jgi:hypothetical protein